MAKLRLNQPSGTTAQKEIPVTTLLLPKAPPEQIFAFHWDGTLKGAKALQAAVDDKVGDALNSFKMSLDGEGLYYYDESAGDEGELRRGQFLVVELVEEEGDIEEVNVYDNLDAIRRSYKVWGEDDLLR